MHRPKRNSLPGRGRRDERGVILILVLLVASILFVITAQFSYSVHLDYALSENQLREVQGRCDLKSAAAVLLAALREGTEERSLSLPLASGTADIRWASESGKFNLNLLRQEDPRISMEQFERLFARLEQEGTLTVLGLAGQIIDFVHMSERPLASLGELRQIDGITAEVLDGGAGGQGLSAFLTVHSDERINLSEAPVQVVACLDEGLNNEKTIELLKEKFADPSARVPDYVSRLADRLRQSVTTESESYLARVTLNGQAVSREVDIAIRQEDDEYRIVLFNEVDESHEAFQQSP